MLFGEQKLYKTINLPSVLFLFILPLNLSIDLYVVTWLISIHLFDLCHNSFLIFSLGLQVHFFLYLKTLCNLTNEFCFPWNVIKGVDIQCTLKLPVWVIHWWVFLWRLKYMISDNPCIIMSCKVWYIWKRCIDLWIKKKKQC